MAEMSEVKAYFKENSRQLKKDLLSGMPLEEVKEKHKLFIEFMDEIEEVNNSEPTHIRLIK